MPPGGCQLSSAARRIEPFNQFNHPHPRPSPAAAGEGNFLGTLAFSRCRGRGEFWTRCRSRAAAGEGNFVGTLPRSLRQGRGEFCGQSGGAAAEAAP